MSFDIRDYLAAEFRNINERMDYQEKLLVGNGQPGLLQMQARTDQRVSAMEAGFATLNKRVDSAVKRDRKDAGKWGGAIGAVTGIIIAVLERMAPK